MALPRKGLSGVEKMADTTAWTNSMAESGAAWVKAHRDKRPHGPTALCSYWSRSANFTTQN